jgi:LysR family transcriptional regulator, regulator for metE and metH
MLLTKEGEVVLLSSQRILDEVERTTRQIRLMTEKDCGDIRLSTECYTSYPWLSGFLRAFQALYPKVDIHIKAEATRHALANLLENKIDVGIFEDNKNKNLVYTPLFSDELFAIVSPGHPWTKRKWIEIEAFQQESYIMYNIPLEESRMYNLIFQNGKPVKLYQVMLTEAILEMVKAGIGVTVQPQWVAARYLKSKELNAVKITRRGLKRTWYAGVLKNKTIPSYMASFINQLSKHMKLSEENKVQVYLAN